MPYPPEHREQTRERIIESAARLFNRRGFSEVSIDEIMAGADLTRGGFYSYFGTKEELYAEAVARILKCNPSERWDGLTIDFAANPPLLARQIVEAYLSRAHFQDADAQCPMIALPSDVARSGSAVKKAFATVLEAMAGIFSRASQSTCHRPRQQGLALAALCIGGMVLARAVDDEKLADDVREAARDMALDVGGWRDAS